MVAVRFAANIAARIRDEHASWMTLTENDDGSLTARFGVSTFNWVIGWVLSYGAAVRVLEPPELIARVRQAAEGALGQYGTGGKRQEARGKKQETGDRLHEDHRHRDLAR